MCSRAWLRVRGDMQQPAKSKRPRLREQQKQLTLALLRDAARELFYARGYDPVSIDDIAAHAGVSRGTLYLHFSSKLEVLGCVLRDDLADQARVYDELADHRHTTVAEMREWIAHFRAQIERRYGSLHLFPLYFSQVPDDFYLIHEHREHAIEKLGSVYPGFDLRGHTGQVREVRRTKIYLMLFEIEQATHYFDTVPGSPSMEVALDILAERFFAFCYPDGP